MGKPLVALAIVAAFGAGIAVATFRSTADAEVVATRPRDEARKPVTKPSIAWPSPASDVGFTWPTSIPAAGEALKIDDTHYQLDRGVVSDAASSLRSVRVLAVPATATTPAGARLLALRATSPLAIAGLRSGDILAYVDEFAMGSPDQALEAYAKLRFRRVITLRIVRDGKPLVLHYQMTEGPKVPKPPMPSVVVPPKKP